MSYGESLFLWFVVDELLADLHSATTHIKAGRGAPIGVFDKQIQSPLYCADQ